MINTFVVDIGVQRGDICMQHMLLCSCRVPQPEGASPTYLKKPVGGREVLGNYAF